MNADGIIFIKIEEDNQNIPRVSRSRDMVYGLIVSYQY